MKVVIANDSFKGSLEAIEVANAIEKGIRNILNNVNIIKKPLADGGEGTVKSLVSATKGTIEEVKVIGPLGEKIDSYYGILGDGKTAVIEMATASGLTLVPFEKRNPMITTTYGTGELIKMALDRGCREFIIGIGGSATNDGGIGMAQALGVRFFDENGKNLKPGLGGEALDKIENIDIYDIDNRLKESKFLVACDVSNPLYGEDGAAFIYGTQKGATEKMIIELDNGLKHYSEIVKRDLGIDISSIEGSGAAGGLGGGMVAFLAADLKSGVEIVIEKLKLEDYIKDCDLVITGEGKIDNQTVYGKVPVGVAKVAKKYNIPVIAIAGCVADNAKINNEYGIDAMFSILNYPISMADALDKEKTNNLIIKNIEQIINLVKVLKVFK